MLGAHMFLRSKFLQYLYNCIYEFTRGVANVLMLNFCNLMCNIAIVLVNNLGVIQSEKFQIQQ